MVNVGLLQKYEVNNKPYLCFPNFGKYQRLRSKTSKYPAPLNGAQNDSCQSHDRHMSDTCPLEEEVEVELEVEEKENLKEKAATVVPENSKKSGNSFLNANANDTETIQAMLEKYDLPLKTELMHFIESRRNMRKPLNAYAFELALDKLNSLSTDTEEQIAIVKQAIANGWQGFYPLSKVNGNVNGNGNGKSYSMHVKPLPDYMNKKGEVIKPKEEFTEEETEEARKEMEEALAELAELRRNNS